MFETMNAVMSNAFYSSSSVTESSATILRHRENERNNLLLLTRLILRGLLEYCMQSKNRLLAPTTPQLLHLFIMLEKVLRHGFRSAAQRTLITLKTPEMELWSMIHRMAKISKDIDESVSCVEQLPNLQAPICRIRAFLRLAVMQKKLGDYMYAMLDARKLLEEHYEDWALMRHESAVVLAGSLIGLSVVDCNLYLRQEDLFDQPMSVDLSSYIKIPTIPLENEYTDEETQSNERLAKESELKNILDQKNYLEELNRQLNANVNNLKIRLSQYENRCSIDQQTCTEQLNAENGNLKKTDDISMDRLQLAMQEKHDIIASMQQQMDDLKRINIDLYQKVRTMEESRKHLDKTIEKLKREHEQEKIRNQEKMSALQVTNDRNDARMKKNTESINNLQQELKIKTDLCSEMRNQLAEKSAEARSFEDRLAKQMVASESLKQQFQALQETELNYIDLKMKYDATASTNAEYEKTLEELGVHLSKSKLQMEDLKEGLMPLAEAQWANDDAVDSCRNCESKFSVSRRKHHCRNCGGIYCNACSDNSMSLPSSAKPVRVCDACYQLLLQRCSGYDTK